MTKTIQMDVDDENSTVVQNRFYSLFEYNDIINKSEGDITEEEDSYSLSVLCTDVPTYLETELTKLLSQKLSKHSIYYDAGSVTQFSVSLEETLETWSCYYCMLKDKEVKEDGSNIKYIVCFLAPDTEMLENFTHDLDNFCLILSKEISKTSEVHTVSKQYLEKWHESTLDFLCRCVKLLEHDIKYLLYCALVDGCLKIEGSTEPVCADLQRFVKMCNMSDIFGHEPTGSMDMLVDICSASTPQETISLTFHDDQFQVNSNNCTKFCEHWGKALNIVDINSPGEIKQAVEAFKAKFIHSINTTKRLLMEAQHDYYAYYRAYKFMKSSGNLEILLNHAHLDDISEVKDVFTDLKKHLLQT